MESKVRSSLRMDRCPGLLSFQGNSLLTKRNRKLLSRLALSAALAGLLTGCQPQEQPKAQGTTKPTATKNVATQGALPGPDLTPPVATESTGSETTTNDTSANATASVDANNSASSGSADGGTEAQLASAETATSVAPAETKQPEGAEPSGGSLQLNEPAASGATGNEAAADEAATTDVASESDSSPDNARRDVSVPLVVATAEEKSQKIAEDWPKPWAALFLTGQQHGYIEPCGCTGLENQKGGLNRRDTLLQQIAERGWDIVPLDAGNQVRRNGRQAEMIFRKSAEAMEKMGYKAVAFGQEDLQLRSLELLQLTASDSDRVTPFVSADVTLVEPGYIREYAVIEVGQKRIGVTAVLGESKRENIQDRDILMAPSVDALKKVQEKMAKEKLDYWVLLAHASLEESVEIAQKVPGFNLIITAGGYGEPTYRPEPIEGSESLMIQVGTKGMYAGLLGLYDDKENPVRYQRIALSSQFADSPRMLEMFNDYQEELKREGLAGLEVPLVAHPTRRKFVGSEACADCHQSAFDIWKDTPHAHATDSLIAPGERTSIQRHFDPECLSCHVTGWNPQKYYRYETGYASLEETPKMVANGCENCHGPGANHVAAENGEVQATEEMLAELREEMKLPLAQAQEKCLECHDLDNSPNFHRDGAFEEYWEQVKHYNEEKKK